jgi:transcriptional regulator with XRE-family HTH domain
MTNQEELLGFVAALREADRGDDAAFQSLLGRGVQLLRLMDKDIAGQFGLSRPTVTRWRNGDNAPHPAMRKPVYTWLEQRATALYRRLEKQSAAGEGASSSVPVAAHG